MVGLSKKQIQYIVAVLKKSNGGVGTEAFIPTQISPMDCGIGWTDDDCNKIYKSLRDIKAFALHAGLTTVEGWARQQGISRLNTMKRMEQWRDRWKVAMEVLGPLVAIVGVIVTIIGLFRH